MNAVETNPPAATNQSTLFLAEAAFFGIAGAALGVLLGRLLAGGTVHLIADTVNALYTTSRPTPVFFPQKSGRLS